MVDETRTKAPQLVSGRPLRELVLAVASDSPRNRAMPVAARLAEAWDLPIRVVHVSESMSSDDPELDAIVEGLKPWFPQARIESKHLFGENPARTIADDLDPHSLAVLATDHVDGWSFDGSVAEALVKMAGLPVMLVGPNAGRVDHKGAIVVGLDGSPAAETAVEPAVALAEALGLHLWLVQVVPKPTGVRPDSSGHEGRDLQELADRQGASAGVLWEVIQSNDPVQALQSFAERRDAAFIVASTTGRTKETGHAMRSITMALVKQAPCPVLVSRTDHDADKPG